jgi:hypothetical protein
MTRHDDWGHNDWDRDALLFSFSARLGAGYQDLTVSRVGCPVTDNVCHLAQSHQRWNVVLHFDKRVMKNLPR